MGTDNSGVTAGSMDIREKLEEIDGLMSGSAYARKWHEDQEKRQTGAYEIDRLVEGETVRNDAGEYFMARSAYPRDYVHGSHRLNDALTVSPAAIAVVGNDAELAAIDLASAAFIDTETTGLAGGTGTYAFMIGAGKFTPADTFEVRQYFMRDLDEEEAMLTSLAEWLRDVSALVTYNGKSFDIPLLRTRFIMARLRADLDGLLHLDLLHAARRLWKRRLGDCSLNNIERNVLDVVRKADVPGSLIPQLYIDYVRSRDARPLVPAFRHNCTDVLSMVTLTVAACNVMDSPHDQNAHPDDRVSIARLYFRRGEMARALEVALELLDDPHLDTAARRETLYLTGFAMKRLSEWDDSSSVWQQLIDEFPHETLPRTELAKYYEHRVRKLDRAATVCEEALSFVQTTAGVNGEEPDETVIDELTHRLNRIRQKMERA